MDKGYLQVRYSVVVRSDSEITTVGKHHSLVQRGRLKVPVVVSVLHCGAVLG
jgi:hypothetical protein